MLPEAEKDQVAHLQAAARAQNIPLVGAVFPALLTRDGFQTAGVTLILLDPCPPWILVEQLGNNEDPASVEKLADFIKSKLRPEEATAPPTVFLIFDGLLPNIGTILFRLYNKLGHHVYYAGVNAGSETFQPMPCLFDHERYLGEGGLALLIPSETKFAVAHGYPTAKQIFKATSTYGNRIDEINGRPALEVYKELVHAEFGIEITPENFYQYAVHYPFGLVTAIDVLVRIPVGLTTEGAIYCVGEIPDNSILKLLHAPDLEQSQCVASLSAKLSESTGAMLTFYCAGRRMHFGVNADEELKALQVASRADEIFGALTLGEIGTDPDMGFPEFHNAALVCGR